MSENIKIDIVATSQHRLIAITEMAKAIHQLAKALTTPLAQAIVTDNIFHAVEGEAGLSINLSTLPED